jgi:hypothetical protein
LAERRAARYILDRFTEFGLTWKRERFPVSYFSAEIASRLIFGCCVLLVVAGAVLATTWPLASALCWAPAAVLVNAPWRVGGHLGRRWPPRTSSANLLATLPDAAEEAPARVVFMAHYDTKSQLVPTGVRVGLVCAVTVACGLLAILGLLAALGLINLAQASGPWITAAGVAGCLTLLAINLTGNRSPGALDNGSAVGTLLELARTWRPAAGVPVEAIWVATGAEEVHLDGARHLLRLHETWWQDKPTLVVNLESVGAGARIFLAGEPGARRLAEATADGIGVSWGRLRVLGAGMDHEPFAARGLPAVSILGDVVRYSLALHSSRDDMGLISHDALDRSGRVAAHLAWRWAEMHAKPSGPGSRQIAGVSAGTQADSALPG